MIFHPFRLLFLLLCTTSVFADSNSLWSDIKTLEHAKNASQAKVAVAKNTSLSLMPDTYRLYRLDEAGMRSELAQHNTVTTGQNNKIANELQLPLPSGKLISLKVAEQSIMAAELAAKYPEIKTYRVDANDNNGIYGVIDITQQGFHAMLFMPNGLQWFVDPRKSADETFYISYYSKHYHPSEKQPLQCNIDEHNHDKDPASAAQTITQNKTAQRSGANLKTYRLVMSATGEYTAFHGGTVASALSAITTTVSRVNVIYERDLAVKLQLVANNNLMIFTDASTDPFTDPADGNLLLDENQAQTDTVIGSANYDIGHVVGIGGGGLAGLGVVCNTSRKAFGETGSSQPVGDAFDIDFVSHEIGHQFGGSHTFNSTTGSCSNSNRSALHAFEPGSGTTIQAYAGICGSTNNIQNNSDAMFHIGSIAQMSDYIDNGTGNTCGVASSLSNQQPIANAGADYTIPANTPFALTGVASDPDGDTLSYSWEQIDAGTASDINVVEIDNAIFRAFLPQNTPTRVFPKLSSIISNTVSKGETLSPMARNINMSFAVRDQKGGVQADEMLITVAASTGFKITSHNTTSTLGPNTVTTVTWDVANTASAPINCSAVNILLSIDEGNTFTTIANTTANDGSESVTIPSNVAATTTGRFKIECANNIFFDISDANLTIQTSGVSILPAILSNIGNNNSVDPGETVYLSIPLQSYEAITATQVSGTLSSSATGVNITVANSAYPDIPPSSQVSNSALYQMQIPSDYVCGTSIPVTLDANFTLTAAATATSNFSIPVGTSSAAATTNSTVLTIPDNDSAGITSTVTLAAVGTVISPEITVDVDITHSFRGDLKLELTSPQGTTVLLKNADSGDNATNLIGNYPNTFAPVGDLTSFNGENLNGDWTLKVSDNFSVDTGKLNSWTLHYATTTCETVTNTAPVATNSSITTNEGIAKTGTLQATDADGNVLIYSIISNGTKGNAVITNTTNGAFTYTPTNGETGQDTFTFSVSDGTITSNIATVTITINSTTPTSTWDIDGDGTVKPLTDGILNIRYLFNFTGSTLIDSAFDATGTRTDATAIEAYLASIQSVNDIDGDGTTKPLTDGLLLLRYLFGFRGDALIQGAVDAGATRQTAAAIEAYIAAELTQ